ncbi:uncharacterized protein RCO7_15203 [Rhynchosporium graminicola]|uniref:Uncharacterized protein n=1 Tax=Rhynchosporium graminicola TaxID=2792576 RepID=A0A1E1LR16_9HELO|nr:uncharacterized protein RCO7_15203 [Rhynchosporium commune]
MNAVDDGPMDRIVDPGPLRFWKELSIYLCHLSGVLCGRFRVWGDLEAFLMMEREGLMLKVGWEDGIYAKGERFWKLSLSSMAVGHFILRHFFEFKWAVNKNNKCIGEVKYGEFDLFSL